MKSVGQSRGSLTKSSERQQKRNPPMVRYESARKTPRRLPLIHSTSVRGGGQGCPKWDLADWPSHQCHRPPPTQCITASLHHCTTAAFFSFSSIFRALRDGCFYERPPSTYRLISKIVFEEKAQQWQPGWQIRPGGQWPTSTGSLHIRGSSKSSKWTDCSQGGGSRDRGTHACSSSDDLSPKSPE